MSAGKGDEPRPVDKQRFDRNFDQIDWSKNEKNKPCRECNGSGFVMVERDNWSGDVDWDICPSCKGDGVYNNKNMEIGDEDYYGN